MTKNTKNINAGSVQETSSPKESIYNNNDVTLQIKEEQLNLAKKWIQTGDVKIYRESFTEKKRFTIPVECEEIVIEKKILASAPKEHIDGSTEIMRIRLSEEKVEFTKHRVVLEDVSIYKQEIEEIKQIEETLKKEELRVKIIGSPKVRDEFNSMHPDL